MNTFGWSIFYMNEKRIVIIIPTYNEALAIEKTINAVFGTFKSTNMDMHVLVFDSASKDNTQSIVQDLQAIYPTLHLLTEPTKSGLGSAYLKAMNHALSELDADLIVEFDADLSHQPHYLIPMIERMTDVDVVVGSRYIDSGSIPANWGWHRKLLSRAGNCVARLMLSRKYKDFTSGFRITEKSALKKALPKQFISSQYAYKIELLWRLHQNNATIIEYPIEFIDRAAGQSKLPHNSIIDSLRVLFVLRAKKARNRSYKAADLERIILSKAKDPQR
jgi:dolichol-phosphate mannosyltransferase